MRKRSQIPDQFKRSSANYLFTAWLGMVRRCTVSHHPAWEYYGGRGIMVCDQWLKSFETFVDDMGHRPSKRHSLDRIDNDKGYSPDNCRWATSKEQAKNRRPRRERRNIIRVNGRSLKSLSAETGIPHGTLKARYRLGKRGADLVARDLRGNGRVELRG